LLLHYTGKRVLRSHPWDKEKVVFKDVQFICNFLLHDKINVSF